ncbi:polysaccharide deacetylase family protein [Spongorhabdus nitratireducens]
MSPWPKNARIAVNFVLNYEEDAERNVRDGDGESESYLTGFPGFTARHGRHESCESFFRYGAGPGCQRLLDLFADFNIPITLFACGLALERNRLLCECLEASDHEVAGHGWRWIDYHHVPVEKEREHVLRTLDTISRLTKKKATGWYTGRKSYNTRLLVIEAGVHYDSDAYDDDLPYYLQYKTGYHLIIPYSLITNDCNYLVSPGWSSPESGWNNLRFAFDGLYRESAKRPAMMTIGLHCRISGHPGRAEALRRFIEYIHKRDGVWICRREDISTCWRKNVPPVKTTPLSSLPSLLSIRPLEFIDACDIGKQ